MDAEIKITPEMIRRGAKALMASNQNDFRVAMIPQSMAEGFAEEVLMAAFASDGETTDAPEEDFQYDEE